MFSTSDTGFSKAPWSSSCWEFGGEEWSTVFWLETLICGAGSGDLGLPLLCSKTYSQPRDCLAHRLQGRVPEHRNFFLKRIQYIAGYHRPSPEELNLRLADITGSADFLSFVLLLRSWRRCAFPLRSRELAPLSPLYDQFMINSVFTVMISGQADRRVQM